MTAIATTTLLTVLYIGLHYGVSNAYQDLTLKAGTKGPEVVRAVIAKLDAFSQATESEVEASDSVFWRRGIDSVFMRRLAYVETLDGTELDTYRPDFYHNGGIWHVSESNFESTKDTQNLSILANHHSTLENYSRDHLGATIVWSDTEWIDLTKPLYSAIAARLYQILRTDNVQSDVSDFQETCVIVPEDIDTQAQYYCTCYRNGTACNESIYKSRVEGLIIKDREDCNVKTDVVFILDSSDNVSLDNWRETLHFVSNYSTELLSSDVDDNLVGVISFGDMGTTSLNLTRDLDYLTHNITTLEYLNGSTNIADGLCELTEVEWRGETNALRFAILVSDGYSNLHSNKCGNTSEVLTLIRTLMPQLFIYVISVTNDTNEEELAMVASSAQEILSLDNFEEEELRNLQRQQIYDTCFTSSTPVADGNNTISRENYTKGERTRYHYSLGLEGLTLRVCVSEGDVVLYASILTSNPNAAYNQFILNPIINDSTAGVLCADQFIDLFSLEQSSLTNRTKRQTTDATNGSVILFIVVEGVANSSTFSLESNPGDTSEFQVLCDDNPCGVNINCSDDSVGYTCTCLQGFEEDALLECKDINECDRDSELCTENAVCVNTRGGYVCECLQGYEKDVANTHNCTDIDECGQNPLPCHSNAVCTNNAGSYTCACRQGYRGNGTHCTEPISCESELQPCGSNAQCSIVNDDFHCQCREGYVGNGIVCTDIDECEASSHDCHRSATCINTNGGYDCECIFGYKGNGTVCTQNTVQIVAFSVGTVGGIFLVFVIIILDVCICRKFLRMRRKKKSMRRHAPRHSDGARGRQAGYRPPHHTSGPTTVFHNPHVPEVLDLRQLASNAPTGQAGVSQGGDDFWNYALAINEWQTWQT